VRRYLGITIDIVAFLIAVVGVGVMVVALMLD